MIRIAVDLAGSEKGAAEVVEGACRAVESGGFEVMLVGPGSLLPERSLPAGVVHHEAPGAVPFHEKVSRELLRQPETSLFQIVRMVKEEKAGAAVSGGNTACFVALATTILGPLAGADRPGIAILLPRISGQATVLIDAGANTACSAGHLHDYGVMGSFLFQCLFNKQSPRVGLVNVGQEEGKGSQLTRQAYELLRQDPRIDFIGNIEGHDLFGDRADVAVTDGFTGNCMLKAIEGALEDSTAFLRARLAGQGLEPGGTLAPALEESFRRSDFAEHSGGFLMGVNGTCLIIHGRSTAEAHRTAILRARDAVANNLIGRQRQGLVK